MSAIQINKTNFTEEVIRSDRPVLLDFWAPWCGPCRMVGPILDEIAQERTDIKVGKVNVDEQPELAGQFGVMSIPTMVVMKGGKVVNQALGARPKSQILALLCRYGKRPSPLQADGEGRFYAFCRRSSSRSSWSSTAPRDSLTSPSSWK